MDAITTTCKLPTSEVTSSTPSSAVAQEQPCCIENEQPILPSRVGETCTIEQSEKLTPLPNQPVANPSPAPLQQQYRPDPESLRIEIPPRRSNSVPDAFSIPWVHQSIPGWRNTSMPSWTLCTHDHHHRNHQYNAHFQAHSNNNNTLSLVSPTSSVIETIVDGDLESPTCGKGIQQSLNCMHNRELSSDTVITAATSVYSDNERIEGDRLKIGRQGSFGLGIPTDIQNYIQNHQYHHHHHHQAQGIRRNHSTATDNRIENPYRSGDHHPQIQLGNGRELIELYAGSPFSLIKGMGNRMPETGIVSDDVLSSPFLLGFPLFSLKHRRNLKHSATNS